MQGQGGILLRGAVGLRRRKRWRLLSRSFMYVCMHACMCMYVCMCVCMYV